jgi:glycosyltransferase involved in cell wall biosynthesis
VPPARRTAPRPLMAATDTRPRIALIVDAKGWAFDNIAKRVSAFLADEYVFDIHYQDDYEAEELHEMALATLGAGYDLVHFFWRLAPTEFILDRIHLGWLLAGESLEQIVDRYLAQPLTISVHDHLFLEPENAERRRLLFSTCGVGYHVSSQRLDGIYRELGDVPPPDAVIEDGVDLDMFGPANLERLADTDREIVVGWAGNSRWNRDDGEAIDYKGLETVVKPAVETLRSRGVPVVGRYRDRAEAWLPYADVPAYFAGIDVYLCASLIEGTATPVLEAMACGLPVISTDVGIVPQLFGPLQREFLLQERSPEAFAAAIERLASDPELRVALSRENLERIQAWTWDATAERWRGFFGQILAHGCGTSPERRACCAPGERRAALLAAATEALQRGAARLVRERKELRDTYNTDLPATIAELDDARRWANDVEERLATVSAERDDLRRRLVPWKVRAGARRLTRAVGRQ